MNEVQATFETGPGGQRIAKQLETLVKERTALGEAFRAYLEGTLTSTDCSTLVDGLLRQFVADAGLSTRDAMLLDMVTDAVAQLANHEPSR